MRNPVVVACGLCAWVLLANPIQAQNDESRAVIERALKALGGEDKVAAVKSAQSKSKGTVSIMGMDLEVAIESFGQPPDKARIVVDLTVQNMNIQILQVYNGDKGWASVDGKTMDLDADTLKQVKEAMYVEKVTTLSGLKDKEYKLSALGDLKVGEHNTVGVLVTREGRRDVSLYFDKTTHLLVKAEYRAIDQFSKQEVNQERFYSEYKELLPGLKVASKLLIHNDGKKSAELTITEVRVVDRHDDSLFAKP